MGFVAGKGWWQPAPGQALPSPAWRHRQPDAAPARAEPAWQRRPGPDGSHRTEPRRSNRSGRVRAPPGHGIPHRPPAGRCTSQCGLGSRGLPSSDQGWEAFRGAIDGSIESAPTRGFTRVSVPVRIGDHGRLNNGLVALWIDDGSDVEARVQVDRRGYGPGRCVRVRSRWTIPRRRSCCWWRSARRGARGSRASSRRSPSTFPR